MNGCSNSSQWSVNDWPFPVFTSAKNVRRISLKSVDLTVLRSTVIFLFSHHFSNFFYSSFSCSLGVFRLSFLPNFIQLFVVKIRVLTRKKLKIWDFFHLKIKSRNVKRSLQSHKVNKCKLINKNSRQLWH